MKEVVNDQVMICVCVSVSVAKPLVADGSAKSHELSLAYDQNSLLKLEPPLVLQEFVNHGMRFLSMCLVTFTVAINAS